ncbi:MAG: NADH-quinone oxidoreductase subunit A [Planctomycetes bacterium]|nr:NADH-quinone oxidoreductase subunit A [Planctomycetota bacterium]
MTSLVFYLIVFLGIGTFFLFFHLMMGKMIRPSKPESEKLTIYECGEPTVGSAWIQFDLRYYVVALLFVIFDVEVAFFFPWAVVFGGANDLARTDFSMEKRQQITRQLVPAKELPNGAVEPYLPLLPGETLPPVIEPAVAKSYAWLAFVDLLIFFGVLMVGFAYLWRRGDIDWVRSTAAESTAAPPMEELAVRSEREGELVGAGK